MEIFLRVYFIYLQTTYCVMCKPASPWQIGPPWRPPFYFPRSLTCFPFCSIFSCVNLKHLTLIGLFNFFCIMFNIWSCVLSVRQSWCIYGKKIFSWSFDKTKVIILWRGNQFISTRTRFLRWLIWDGKD
jgi:hypothetical protein